MIIIAEFISGVKEKYPAQLLKGRIEIEGNVISCFFKDMLLLDDTCFERDNFITSDGRFYFAMLNQLRSKGFYSLDEVTILSNLPEETIEIYEDMGGWETIQHQIDIINVQNFDTYIDILYRENIILKMHDDGFNLLKEIESNGKKIIPLKLFHKMTSEEVTDWYEARISSYGTGYSSKVLEEEIIDFDDEFIDSCAEGSENGVPFDIAGYDKNGEEMNCFPFLSNQIMGLLEGTTTMMGGYSSTGKALTLDSDLMTPNGYIKMKDINMGDLVIGDDGKPHSVIGVFPQGIKKIYRITFSDRNYVDCSEDHLWTVMTSHDASHGGNYRTVSVKDILDKKVPYYYDTKNGIKYNLRVPMCKPIEFELKEKLPIDPYALGLLIGDGSFVTGTPKFTNPENDVVDLLREKLGKRYSVNRCAKDRNYEYCISDNEKASRERFNNGEYKEGYRNGIKTRLIDLGLFGCTAEHKFIPDIYKFASVNDRIEVLSGLMDTDGEISRQGLYEISSKSEKLIKDIKFIVESLGGTCTYSKRLTKYTKKNGEKSEPFESYRCYFKFNKSILPFKSQKHIKQYQERPYKSKRGTEPVRVINNIEYIGEQECQCISVDNPSHLYLTNNCIVTHNTTWWVTVIMALLHYDRNILIISNEESVKKFKVKFMVWLLGKRNRYFKLTKKKMSTGNIDSESRIELADVQKFWKENYKGKIKFISINDADMSVVKKKIRENVLRYGYDTVLYDTFKIQGGDMGNSRQDLALVRDSRELDKIAKKYNLIMLASVQLAENTKGKLFLDAGVLSNSKQIKEQLENLLLMRTIYAEELDEKNKFYCRPFRLKKVNNKWIEEDYHVDPLGVYRILFTEKCRSGANSSDNGIAYLLKYDGDHCIFREVAQCRPRHGEIR